MTALDLGEIAQELADAGVAHLLDRAFIKTAGFEFHHFHLLAHFVNAQWLHQPHRPPLDKTLHVLPANERDVLAEALPINIDQAGAVLRFFLPHLVEDLGGVGIGFPQTIGKIRINAAVLFFQRNGERQDLARRELLEFFCHPSAPWSVFVQISAPQ